MPTVSKEVTIINKNGLHARPAMRFVDLANEFKSEVTVHKDAVDEGEEALDVDGKSVMQMITLEAVPGTVLLITATGDDAEAAVDRLAGLFESKFGEE
jgi:phosphotransferase system HPr (HPr) family protein